MWQIEVYGDCHTFEAHLNSLSFLIIAPVAQWIEHWIPNPCAASSILAGGTNSYLIISDTYTILHLALF